MSTYTQLLYHLVFSTRNRERSLTANHRRRLFKYIHQLLINKNCHLYRINGVEDHLHILTSIHPNISLSSLVKDKKLASSDFIRKEQIFPNFRGWQEGYGAFTESFKAKERLINYIKNQESHHQTTSFLDEYKSLLVEFEIEFEEKYLL